MKYTKIILTCCLLIPFSFLVSAGEKHALIIAVGDYPEDSGWKNISSENDVTLIKKTLLDQQFNEKNINVLTSKNATKEGILTAFKQLQNQVKSGDVVVIHYSGHGQQIFDSETDGFLDEVDGLDEALVPYDAKSKFQKGVYEGENHLRDDLFGDIVADLRNKLGQNGQLLIILDSCHSGTATRGGEIKHRGTSAPFAPGDWTPAQAIQKMSDRSKANYNESNSFVGRKSLKSNTAPYVVITGASSDELNYEYKGYGSLSYAFAEAMTQVEKDFSYRQLFSKISTIMASEVAPNQKPTLEGDVDYIVFSGDIVEQKPYFEVIKVDRFLDMVTINGGEINGLYDSTTVFIMPEGSKEVDSAKIITTGKVIKSKFNSARIILDKKLDDPNAKKYWVFIDQPSFGDIRVNVYFDRSVKEKNVRDEIAQFLTKNNLGEVVEDINSSDLIVDQKGQSYSLSATRGDSKLEEVEASRGNPLEELKNNIFNFAQGSFLKGLSLKDVGYEFEFSLIPVGFDRISEEITKDKDIKEYYNRNDIFELEQDNDYAMLQVVNKSNNPLYISIVEINHLGEISPLIPSVACDISEGETLVQPGQTVRYECLFAFSLDDPEKNEKETFLLKGFASNQPLNFKATVSTRGSATTSNPLETFLQSTYNQTRSGATGVNLAGSMKGYSNEFLYEVRR